MTIAQHILCFEDEVDIQEIIAYNLGRAGYKLNLATDGIKGDDGIGIDKANQERIFERFYRVDKARSKSLGGTRLGLANVKHIVQSHKGSLQLKSTLNQGSTFLIKIPLASDIN